MLTEQSQAPPARALSQALRRVAPERAQLSRVFGDPRAARQCGFATHRRRISPNDAARLRLQLDTGQMDVRIAARDGLALLLNEDDHALRVSIAGILLADRLGALAPLGLGAAEVIAFERDAEPDDCHGIGITLGDLDAIALTASAPCWPRCGPQLPPWRRPRHCQCGWPHCASTRACASASAPHRRRCCSRCGLAMSCCIARPRLRPPAARCSGVSPGARSCALRYA